MIGSRNAIHAGFIYSLPVAIWVLSELSQDMDALAARALMSGSLDTLFLLQSVAIALFVPRFLAGEAWPRAFIVSTMLIALPWPLMGLAWLAESAGLLFLCLVQGGLLGFALILWGATRWVLLLLSAGKERGDLAVAGMQLLSVSLVLFLHFDGPLVGS